MAEQITVKTQIHKDVDTVWESWTSPEHITQWNFASDQWCCPQAFNDLKPGGGFSYRMEAKDGSIGFDFSGMYTKVEKPRVIEYTLDDGRKTIVTFTTVHDLVEVVERFDAEESNSIEMQKSGWQAILDNFRKHTESI
jgi:uncharacterized protein YndB with AHSA1/START domain